MKQDQQDKVSHHGEIEKMKWSRRDWHQKGLCNKGHWEEKEGGEINKELQETEKNYYYR